MKRMRKDKETSLSDQMNQKAEIKQSSETSEYDGTESRISTGSTLLDLAISGGRFEEGGIPTGILLEIFGPASCGKTVLLCQLAGEIQRLGGAVLFHDPEARLNTQFAKMFGLDMEGVEYTTPDTIPQVFDSIRDWIPDEDKEAKAPIRGVFADSLAALSTNLEMTDGDKMGMRRAKEFSEELRKTCRILAQSGTLMVGSNQIRQNLDVGGYGQKYKSPGGEALGFYSSLRLRCLSPQKIKLKRKALGKEHERIIGVKTTVEIYKSSVWKPYRQAEVYILYDYGIDDIRGNLRFLKTSTSNVGYSIGDRKLGRSIEESIQIVEQEGLEEELRRNVITTWKEIEETFIDIRKPKI
jgi:recombination protein RecA